MTFSASFVCNREVRLVPKGWRHPREKSGRFAPLLPRPAWDEAMRELEPGDPQPMLPMPPVEGLPPEWTRIVAYETTSEGTPVSPSFPNTPAGRLALVNYCAGHCTTWADHRADLETWAAILFGDASAWVEENGSVSFA